MSQRILIVDDEDDIREFISYNLRREGYQVYTACDGKQASEVAESVHPHLILLDMMMPVMDGRQTCKAIRESAELCDTMVVFLSAVQEEQCQIDSYEAGADDYITKPFNILEVKARIKAIMRRTAAKGEGKQENSLVAGSMRIDLEERRVYIDEKEINLTSKEFDVLELLAKNSNHVYSREKLLHLVWGVDYPGDVRTVDVHIRRLREKIEKNPSEPKFVHTKWGVGYYFKA